MNRGDIVDIVVASCGELLRVSDGAVDESTRLFGRNGALDSMQLLTLVFEVEQRVNDESGAAITIADDRAMSQERSPFRTVGDLATYVHGLVTEQIAAR